VGCIQRGGQGGAGTRSRMRDLVPAPPWPPLCIQPTQVECSPLPMFLIYQPEDGQWKGPKYVVVLFVINYTYLYHHIVVLHKYTHSNLFYYKHNGDDEPYDPSVRSLKYRECFVANGCVNSRGTTVLVTCRYIVRKPPLHWDYLPRDLGMWFRKWTVLSFAFKKCAYKLGRLIYGSNIS